MSFLSHQYYCTTAVYSSAVGMSVWTTGNPLCGYCFLEHIYSHQATQSYPRTELIINCNNLKISSCYAHKKTMYNVKSKEKQYKIYA